MESASLISIRRYRKLESFAAAYYGLGGIIAILAGLLAGSMVFLGFGVYNLIEIVPGMLLLWHLRESVAGKEGRDISRGDGSVRLLNIAVGLVLIGFVLYLSLDALLSISRHVSPRPSVPGILLALLSLTAMPILGREKIIALDGFCRQAISAEVQRIACGIYLSATLLSGLLLIALLKLWWADSVAALVMSLLIGGRGAGLLLHKVCSETPLK